MSTAGNFQRELELLNGVPAGVASTPLLPLQHPQQQISADKKQSSMSFIFPDPPSRFSLDTVVSSSSSCATTKELTIGDEEETVTGWCLFVPGLLS